MSTTCLTVCNSKGGVSKSTLSVLLAAALSRHLKVAVADSDPQGTASLWAAAGKLPFPVLPVTTEADIRALMAQYPLVIVDCPPQVDAPIMTAALGCATLALVPCAPEPADVWATTLLLQRVRNEFAQLETRVVLTKVPSGTALARDTLASIEAAGWPLARARMGLRTAFKEAMAVGGTLEDLKGPGAVKARQELQDLALEAMTTVASL
jgi:chromosome partitioning protein